MLTSLSTVSLNARLRIMLTAKEEAIRLEIINWLSPLDSTQRQKDIASVRQEGTGQWLLESPEFQEWKTEIGKELWCYGIRV